MADSEDATAKLTEITNRNDGDCGYADKENEPVLLSSDNEKKREERDEKKREEREEGAKGDGDYIKLSIGEQYMVRRAEDTWRKYKYWFA